MPQLKLAPLLDAAQPERFRPTLEPFLNGWTERVRVDNTHAALPICYWLVYLAGDRRVTLKAFLSEDDYLRYARKLEQYYPQQMGRPDHPRGGVLLVPELNGILWSYPFDPIMTELWRCADPGWVSDVLGRRSEAPLVPEVVSYRPEIGSILRYRDPESQEPVAYGKCAPEDNTGRIFVVMNRLWESTARQEGRLHVPRPLAYRPEVGLLLQSPVPGAPIYPDRNTQIFRDLANHAGETLAAIHDIEVPFGQPKRIETLLERLQHSLEEMAYAGPAIYPTLEKLLAHLTKRVGNGSKEPIPLVGSHGDCKWDQFLEHDGRFSLIDFELFCQADRAYDLGYFCAYLPPSSPEDWRESAAAEVLRTEFLERYREASGMDLPLDRIGMYESAMLAIRALARAWSRQPNWQIQVAQMLDLAFERLFNPELKRPATE